MQGINLREEMRSTVQGKREADQDEDAEKKTEEKTKERRSKRKAPDSGIRRPRQFEQGPRRTYSDTTSENIINSDSEELFAAAKSTGSEGAFCTMGIASENSPQGLGTLVKRRKHWRDRMAIVGRSLWQKRKKERSGRDTTPRYGAGKTRFIFIIKHAEN